MSISWKIIFSDMYCRMTKIDKNVLNVCQKTLLDSHLALKCNLDKERPCWCHVLEVLETQSTQHDHVYRYFALLLHLFQA